MGNAKTGSMSLANRLIANLEPAKREVVKHAKEESHGSDGITIKNLDAEWKTHKRVIQERIRGGTYRFEPLWGVAIRKDPTKPVTASNARPISIPSVRDRVVQRAMLAVMWCHIRDHVWTECSFGGIRPYKLRKGRTRLAPLADERGVAERPVKSVRSAIERIVQLRRDGFDWVFETDIRSFFPSVNKARLLEQVKAMMPDRSLDLLLEGAVVTEVGNAAQLGGLHKLWNPEDGVPQGGILSPVLSNLYLHDFDMTLRNAGFKLVRYVDDLVVMCESEARAAEAHRLVEETLAQLDLEIHALSSPLCPTKTSILPPGHKFDFLGVTLSRNSIHPRLKKWHALRERIDEVTHARTSRLKTLTDVVTCVNAIVQGWVTAFRFCNISAEEIEQIDTKVRDRVGSWMMFHGLTSNRNVLDERRAHLLGLKSAKAVPLLPMLSHSSSNGRTRA